MQDARVNSAELLAFCHRLEAYSRELEQSSQSIVGDFRRLSETWQDATQQKFEGDFQQLLGAIQRLNGSIGEHLPQLKARVSRIEEYLNIR